MSTSKNFLMNKGMSYKVTAKARGYYDYSTILNPDGTAITYAMTPYDGLKYNVDLAYNAYRDATIDFSQTKLPYLGLVNQSLQTSEYCLRTTGQNYDLTEYNIEYNNIEISGNPIIIDGVASNFSSNNYVNFLRNKFTGNDEIIIKFKLNTIKNCAIFHCEFFLAVEISGTSLICYNWQQSTAQTILDSVETNKWYWVKVEITDIATRKYSISTDGITYTEKLSTTDTSAVLTYQSYDYMHIGNSSFNTSNMDVDGSIDLKESKITVGENIINLGEYIIQNQYTGYTTYGNAKVNNLVCSGFDSSSKVILSNVHFNKTENIFILFTTGADVNSVQKIFDSGDKIGIRISEGYCWYYKNENHTWIRWKSVSTNTAYRIKSVINSKDDYSLGWALSDDHTYDYTYITDVGINLTDGQIGIGNNLNNYDQPFSGTINITSIPGAYEVITKSYAGVYDPDYVDTGAAETLNCFSNSNQFVVLSEKENYQNYTYLGTVTIPQHKVFTGGVTPEPSAPDTPTINPSTLKFGDRIDNKATVVGTFESSDLGTVVFAVLDSTYYGNHNWAYGLKDTDTGLPNYQTENDVLKAKESATYNTNYIINNYDNVGAFSLCRSIEPVIFNNKSYKCQLPNAYELQQIYNNRTKLYELDPTASSNTSFNLSKWETGTGFDLCSWASNESSETEAWQRRQNDWSPYSKDDTRCVIPIIEIPINS